MAVGAAIGSVVGGVMQSRAASKGAAAQERAAREANALQKEMYDTNRADIAPYRKAGYNALAAMNYEMGLGPKPTFGGTGAGGQPLEVEAVEVGGGGAGEGVSGIGRSWLAFGDNAAASRIREQRGIENMGKFDRLKALSGSGGERTTRYRVGGKMFDTMDEAQAYATGSGASGGTEYGGFKASPGYQHVLEQGEQSIERAQAARGMRLGGAALKEMSRFNTGLASQEYGNFYNRLAGIAGTGQTAVNTGAALGANYAGAAGANMMAAGQAKASGYQGQANAFSGAINSLGNVYGAAKGGYFGANPGFGITPSPAGLKMYGYS